MGAQIEVSPETIESEKLYQEMGLSDEEYQMVKEKLGRRPNYTETGLFSVMWSEHCSYKSSKPILKKFPTKGPQVIQGPGEGAGVVNIGDDQAVVFKMESHNSPSARSEERRVGKEWGWRGWLAPRREVGRRSSRSKMTA